ncbi:MULTISPECIES: GNAT family N-acetyltransferase [Aquimarina]|uniref:GNAT family N-acetyltransferase n=1 Tax=Aquimarina TaxID=290174 RepID=UPI000D690855|nr:MULTISPECIES: GNAT family N-acetyltransferase [Aquimarina]
MEIVCKEYSNENISDILQMMKDFNTIDGYPFDAKIREKNLIEFTNKQSLGRLYLIKNRSNIIGYILLIFGFSFEYGGHDAFIDEFYIKDDFRNQGIGKMVLEFIEKQSQNLKINAIHLEVEHHNKSANHLYLKQGFKDNQRALLTKKIKTSTINN